jgi:asparagine synthetase A
MRAGSADAGSCVNCQFVWLEQECEALRAERDRLRDALREVVEAWDWWNVDTYDRCSSVVADAVREARAALKGDTP